MTALTARQYETIDKEFRASVERVLGPDATESDVEAAAAGIAQTSQERLQFDGEGPSDDDLTRFGREVVEKLGADNSLELLYEDIYDRSSTYGFSASRIAEIYRRAADELIARMYTKHCRCADDKIPSSNCGPGCRASITDWTSVMCVDCDPVEDTTPEQYRARVAELIAASTDTD